MTKKNKNDIYPFIAKVIDFDPDGVVTIQTTRGEHATHQFSAHAFSELFGSDSQQRDYIDQWTEFGRAGDSMYCKRLMGSYAFDAALDRTEGSAYDPSRASYEHWKKQYLVPNALAKGLVLYYPAESMSHS